MNIVIILRNNRAVVCAKVDTTPHGVGPKSSKLIPALNWERLEIDAMAAVQAAGKSAEIYDCPPELAVRASFDSKQENVRRLITEAIGRSWMAEENSKWTNTANERRG